MTFTNVFGGQPQSPSQVFLTDLTLAADTELFWPWSGEATTDLLAKIMRVAPTGGGHAVQLPPSAQASNGEASIFINTGANTFDVNDADGNNIASVTAGTAKFIYLVDNATEAWGVFTFGTGSSSADASALAGAGLIALSGTLNEQMGVSDVSSSGFNLTSASRAILYNWTGGAGAFTTDNPATLGSGWFSSIKNSGSGAITITPVAGTIDGAASKTLNPTDSCFIVRDGGNLITIGFGQSTSFTFDYVAINVAGTGNFVLNASQQNRISYRFTGLLTGNRHIIVPATVQQYWVDNSTTGAFTLDVGVAAQPTPVDVAQMARDILYCNGTEVVDAVTGGGVSTPVSIANGGTGATTASGARSNLGATAVGEALFTAVSAAAGRTALGLGALSILNTVGAAQIDADAVTTVKILDANVTTSKIADLNVTTGKLAALAVTTAKIADLNVTTGKIADNAVTFAKMQAITDGRLLGASGGTAVEEITVGSGLTLAANVLSSTAGKIINTYYDSYTANTNLPNNFTLNDTAPTNLVGTQILTVTAVTTSATQKVRLRFGGVACGNTVGATAIASLYQNGTSVRTTFGRMYDQDRQCNLFMEFEVVIGSATSTIFTINAGGIPSFGVIRMNGTSTGRLFGGTAACTLVADVIEP